MKYEWGIAGDEGMLGVLATASLRQVLPLGEIVTHPEGSIVCQPDQLASCVFLVLSGSCAWRGNGAHTRVQSAEHYTRGDTFGGNRTGADLDADAELEATTECVLLKIPRSRLAELAQPTAIEEPLDIHSTVDDPGPDIALATANETEGRLLTLADLQAGPDGVRLQRVLAACLQQETGASVALVELMRTDCVPPERRPLHGELNGHRICTANLTPTNEPYHLLRLGFSGESPSSTSLRPFLEELRRRFSYVLVALPAAITPVSLLFDCVSQCDTAYLFVGPEPESLHELHTVLHELRPRLNSHTPVKLRPILCLADGESPRTVEPKIEAAGICLHACVRRDPALGSRSTLEVLTRSSARFDRDVRRLAREIGGCLVGLALSSGGVKGMAHVGVIQVLEENGLDADIVAGSSMGAYIGSLWAYGCNAAKLMDLAMEMSTKAAIWRVLDPVFPPRQGFLRGRAIKRRLEQTIGDAHFSDLMRPLRIVATDLDTLERAVFSSGEVSTAVHASAAVPGIIVPVRIGDRAFMDGGIVDPLPTDVLWEMGVRRILAVSTIPTPGDIQQRSNPEGRRVPQVKPRARKLGRSFPPIGDRLNYFAQGNLLDIFMHGIQGGQIRLTEPAFKQANLVLRPRLTDTRWLDFSITRKCVAAGRAVAERHLDEIKALLSNKGVRHEFQSIDPTMATTA